MTRSLPIQAPLFTLKGFAIAALLSLLLCWPMVLTGDVYVYNDTIGYITSGHKTWQLFWGFFDIPFRDHAGIASAASGADSQTVADELLINSTGGPRMTRSIVYSAFASPLIYAIGPVALAWAQGILVIFSLFALIDRSALASRWILVAGAFLVIFTSSLPWRTVYLMPDVLGSIILIFGAALTGPFDRLTRPQKVALTLMAAFATGTHYGNIPLAAGVCLSVIAWRMLSRQLTKSVIMAAFVAISLSPLINAAASAVVLGNPSATPLRLPILLARSIEDGPAKWYLENDCEQSNWTICKAFQGRVPDGLGAFLWGDQGIQSLSPQMAEQIREEEYRFLFEVFRKYPVAQTRSLIRNSVLQAFLVGQGQIQVQDDFSDYLSGRGSEGRNGQRLRDLFDPVIKLVTLASMVIILGLAILGRFSHPQIQIVIAILVGLALNALIFGGLSAPADRYQSRIAWLIPAILALLLGQLGKRHQNVPHSLR